MGRHHATPTHTAARLAGVSLAAGALTLTGAGTAWAGEHNPTTECGAMEPGDAEIAAPVCAPVDLTVYAPISNLVGDVDLDDLDVLEDTADLVGDLVDDLL